MRKTLAVLCGIALLLAGCNDDQAGPSTASSAGASASTSSSPSASPSPSPSPSPARSVDPVVAANTKQVCGELKKVMEDQTLAFLMGLAKYGDASTITDPAKQAAVVAAAKKGFTAWANAVRPLSAKAQDPALRKVIDDQVAALNDTGTTLTSLDQLTSSSGGMVSPQMQAAARETTEVCG